MFVILLKIQVKYLILVVSPGFLPCTAGIYQSTWRKDYYHRSSLWITWVFISSLIFPPTTWGNHLEDQFEARCVSESWAPPLPPLPPISSDLGQTSTCVTNRQQDMLLKVNGFFFYQFTSSEPYIRMPWLIINLKNCKTSTNILARIRSDKDLKWRIIVIHSSLRTSFQISTKARLRKDDLEIVYICTIYSYTDSLNKRGYKRWHLRLTLHKI